MGNELLEAAEKRSLKAIEKALAAKADLEARNDDGDTALCLMCRSKSGVMSKTEVAAALLLIEAGADVHAKGDYGATPLLFAVESDAGHVAIEALLKAGADPKAVDQGGNTALHRAVDSTHANDTKLWDRLIALGCDVNARNETGETPMHKAGVSWNHKGVKYLLEHGGDRDATDNDGATVLANAIKYKQDKIVALLERGAANKVAPANKAAPAKSAKKK